MADLVDIRAIVARHRAGEFLAAEREYLAYLDRHPEDPTCLHFLGLLCAQRGRLREGIAMMLRALEANPRYIDAWINLGVVFFQERDYERAEKCHRRATALDENNAKSWAALGAVLRARGQVEQALSAWKRALQIDRQVAGVATQFGSLLYKLNRIEQARDFYRDWLQVEPDNAIAQHMLAATGGTSSPARASDAYVRDTFNGFAESFDESLANLSYRAPQLIHEAALKHLGSDSQKLHVLDVGCGTGLCAPLFRPLAEFLAGVDLSPKMLAKAAERGLYDQLNQAELTAFLTRCAGQYDLLVAADVLCYFGDLSSALAAARGALRPGGQLVFSLEADTRSDAASYALQPHGRYQHARDYLRSSLTSAGFVHIDIEQECLRYERGPMVQGFIATASAAQSH